MDFFTYAWPLACAAILGLVKLWVDKMQKEIDSAKDHVHEIERELNVVKLQYVHKVDMQVIKDEIMQRFTRFEDLLESIRRAQ